MTVELVSTRGAASFPPITASVPSARKWIRQGLSGFSGGFVDSAEMLTSEVVTNAVRHGEGQISLSYTVLAQHLRVAVYDKGSKTEPVTRTPDIDNYEVGGWGLQLMTLFGAAWGTEATPDGNRLVWFELPLPQED